VVYSNIFIRAKRGMREKII